LLSSSSLYSAFRIRSGVISSRKVLPNPFDRRSTREPICTGEHDMPRALAAWESVVGGGNGNAAVAREASG
jgi:hypothetical protein